MLRDAIREMEAAVLAEDRERRRRIEARAQLSQAEAYAAAVEDLVELDRPAVPASLATEIRRFVGGHSRRLARAVGAQPRPARLLDVLFDVQERIQRRMELASAA
ncbi:MAG: hypothetical protein ACREQ5_28150 [Candidatus Dormibacteria bacterium]